MPLERNAHATQSHSLLCGVWSATAVAVACVSKAADRGDRQRGPLGAGEPVCVCLEQIVEELARLHHIDRVEPLVKAGEQG